ncbi:MAG: 16S rRNA (guanine(527)-N(7))-methyltransferase RsmG [Pseudomonadota bacterium]
MNQLGDLDVSRETIERLKIYEAMLHKWNAKINLVAKSTLLDVWTRHILDSAQLFSIPDHPIEHWADLGSGGGFPGLVIAILAADQKSPSQVTLVESDSRKCTFLRSVLRETGAVAKVVSERIEEISALNADVVSARALADLTTLFSLAHPHVRPGGLMLFSKGEKWKTEVQEAQTKWQFIQRVVKSKTSDGPVILCATGVVRV